jgi:hypothetical protein
MSLNSPGKFGWVNNVPIFTLMHYLRVLIQLVLSKLLGSEMRKELNVFYGLWAYSSMVI